MINKKAISPVLATVLLLIVVAGATTFFSGWFGGYTSSLSSDVESQKTVDSLISVQGISNNELGLKSTTSNFLNILKITGGGGSVVCEMSDDKESDLQQDTLLLFSFDSFAYNTTHAWDFSGYSYNGTINGTTYVTSDCVSDECLYFEGTDDEVFVSGITPPPTDTYTVSFWVKPNELGRQQNFVKFGYQDRIVPYMTSLNKFACWIGNNTVNYNMISSSDVSLGEWVHVVCTHGSNGLILYLDGREVISNSSVSVDFDTGSNFHASFGVDSDGTNKDFWVNGTMDEIAIYKKAISADEVKILYDVQKAKFYEHLLPYGTKEINVSSCSLQSGLVYNVVAFTNSQSLEEKVIVN